MHGQQNLKKVLPPLSGISVLFTLQMEEVRSFETFVTKHNPEDLSLHFNCSLRFNRNE